MGDSFIPLDDIIKINFKALVSIGCSEILRNTETNTNAFQNHVTWEKYFILKLILSLVK